MQILSKRYIKNHPNFLNDSSEPKKISPRGGAAGEILVGKTVAKAVLSFLAEHGLTAGLLSGAGVNISKIPLTAISTYLREASIQQNLIDKNLCFNGNEKLYSQCDEGLEYLLTVLNSPDVPFQDKKKLAYDTLTKYLNFKTEFGRRNFVLCLIFILSVLATQNPSSFYILMQNLIKAIKEGKISKAMARAIVRKMRKKGFNIDPELNELILSP